MMDDTLEIIKKECQQEGYEEGYKKGYEAGLQASKEDVWKTATEVIEKHVTEINYKNFIERLIKTGLSITMISRIIDLPEEQINALL